MGYQVPSVNQCYDFSCVIGQLQAWCCSHAPLVQSVYDECKGTSLSEQVAYLFGVVRDVVKAQQCVDENFKTLYDFVKDFFENLDLQEEVNEWLDKAFESGKLMTLFNKFIPYVTPEMFGAKGDGVTDDTESLIQAINSSNKIICSKKYLVSDKIELYSPNYEASAKILEVTGKIIANNGFLWIHGENVILTGGGTITGSSPEALVVMGALDTEKEVSAVNCRLENIFVEPTDDHDGVILRNYFLGNYGCYCNYISDVYVRNAKIAFHLIGDVNANVFNSLVFETTSGNRVAMFVFEGILYNTTTYAPLENNFNSCFYYRGNDTPMFLIKENTGTKVYRNVFTNITCEQFGGDACVLIIEESAEPRGNQFIGIADNTNLGFFGNSYTRNIIKKYNAVICSAANLFTQMNIGKCTVDSLKITERTCVIQNDYTANENTEFNLFNVGGNTPTGVSPRLYGGFIEVIASEFYTGVTTLQKTSRSIINLGTNPSIAEESTGSRISVSGNNVNYKTGNNGTAITGVKVSVIVISHTFVDGAEYMIVFPS